MQTRRGDLIPGDVGSDTFQLEVDSHPVPVTSIPSLATADYPAVAAEFNQFKQACWIDPPRFMGVHYAQFEADGPVSVSITCPSPILSCTVHPQRRGVKVTVDANRVTFHLDRTQPRYYVLDIEPFPPLILIIEEVDVDAPNRSATNVLDIGEFVTDSGTVEERTEAFQRVFLEASRTRKTLYVAAGVYLVNTLKFHNVDGLRIYFAPGSLIRTDVSPAGANIHSHGLWFEDSKNIHIFGRGCLDHQGFGDFEHGRNAYNHGLISYYVSNALCPWLSESPVFMLRCSNVTIEGFMVRNGRNMNYNIRRCDDIALRRCKIVTPPASCPEYADGYHTNSCRNVLIENCLAFCNDDCFASGHYTHFDDRDASSHTIRGLVGWNVRANGIRLGFHTYYNLGDYTFENCDFSGFIWRGLMVHPLHDAEEANRFQRFGSIRLNNCSFDCSRPGAELIEVDGARIDLLELDGCTFDRMGTLNIRGHDEAGKVDKLVLRNLDIGGRRVTRNSDAALQTRFVGEISVT